MKHRREWLALLLTALLLSGCASGPANRGPAEELDALFADSEGVTWAGCDDEAAVSISLLGNNQKKAMELQLIARPDGALDGVIATTSTIVSWDAQSLAVYADGDPVVGAYPLPVEIYEWEIVPEAGGETRRLDMTLVYAAGHDRSSASGLETGKTFHFYPLQLETRPSTPQDPDDVRVGVLAMDNRTPEQRSFARLADLYWQRYQTPDPETGDLSHLLAAYRGATIEETFIGNGLDPSLENRQRMAEAAGIPDYTGTEAQDAQLMQALGAPEQKNG